MKLLTFSQLMQETSLTRKQINGLIEQGLPFISNNLTGSGKNLKALFRADAVERFLIEKEQTYSGRSKR